MSTLRILLCLVWLYPVAILVGVWLGSREARKAAREAREQQRRPE